MTVNQRVSGSSPEGGATKTRVSRYLAETLSFISEHKPFKGLHP